MPIFLDQSLRKSILSKIREVFDKDEVLGGQVRVLEQESFLPEAPNQVLLTNIQVANESLDASNRVTDLFGTLTFAPLKKPESSFLFWAQENTHQKQLLKQGFYHLKLNKTSEKELPDQCWNLSVEAIPRVTEHRKPWMGLRVELSLDPSSYTFDFNLKDISITQQFEHLIEGEDYVIMDKSIYIKRYAPDTRVFHKDIDITHTCFYWDLASRKITFRRINPPIQLPEGSLLNTISAYNLTYNHTLYKGFTLSKKGLLTWKNPVKPGVEILLQFYQLKPLLNWELPSEFILPLEATPLTYSSGDSSLVVTSSLRGILKRTSYEIVDKTLRILEPFPNESISIDYRYHLQTLPVSQVFPSTISDNVIPGICLTFTDNFIDGDEAVIIKHEEIKSVGEEHGGNNLVELSLRLRSADDKMLERMTSRVYFLFTDQRSLLELSNQGIILDNSVSYARTYEDRDGNAEKWLVNTFNLKVHHNWKYLIPYVSDLNSMSISIGSISSPMETGAPTLKELLYHSTEPNWLQPY